MFYRHAGLDPKPALFLIATMKRAPCVSILARASHITLYTGGTSDLLGRIHQHLDGYARGFTRKYGINRLVWVDPHETMQSAILREKRAKGWPRAWKYDLIHNDNPTWRDLAEDFELEPLPLREPSQEKAGPGSRPG